MRQDLMCFLHLGPFFMMLILPVVVLTAAVAVAVLWWRRSGRGQGLAVKIGLVVSVVVGIVFVYWGIFSIKTSKSSTAAVGYVFLPYLTAILCVLAYVVSWAIARIVLFFTRREGLRQTRWTFYAAVCILIIFGVAGFRVTTRQMLLHKARTQVQAVDLKAICNAAIAARDIKLLTELASNSNASEEILLEIYSAIPDAEFGSLGSQYSPVFSALAKNHNTPPEIIKSLAERRENIRIIIALNPNTRAETLVLLSDDQNRLVRTWICRNPNITREILEKLKNDPDAMVREYAKSAWSRRGYSE